MTLILVLSVLFLLSPLIGYIVISLDMSVRAKIIIAGVSVFVLTIVPLLVLLVMGGSGGS
jgi:hypothetical protein